MKEIVRILLWVFLILKVLVSLMWLIAGIAGLVTIEIAGSHLDGPQFQALVSAALLILLKEND